MMLRAASVDMAIRIPAVGTIAVAVAATTTRPVSQPGNTCLLSVRRTPLELLCGDSCRIAANPMTTGSNMHNEYSGR